MGKKIALIEPIKLFLSEHVSELHVLSNFINSHQLLVRV